MVKIIVWAIPRSVSTAFEKAFIQNENVKVMHEPFSIPYYFGKERKSERYESDDCYNNGGGEQESFLDVYKKIINDESDVLFIKDMAYYVNEFIETEEGNDLLERCEHAFLFRDPVKSIYSLYKGSFDKETGWNSFDENEIGFESLKKVYDKCLKIGKKTIVIDSDKFLANPKKMIKTFCDTYGITYTEKMLKLEKTIPEWKVWEPWHKVAIDSKEFFASNNKEYDNEIIRKIEPYIKRNIDLYNYFKTKSYIIKD